MKKNILIHSVLVFLFLAMAVSPLQAQYDCNSVKKDMETALSKGNCEQVKSFYNKTYRGSYKCPQDKDIELKIAKCIGNDPKPTPIPTPPNQTAGNDQTITVNGVSFKMVYVEGGTFTMGCTSEQGGDCYSDEKPSHQVTLTKDFYIGETEVTQALWRAVMGSEPTKDGGWTTEYGRGDDFPVYCVSLDDVQGFVSVLNRKTGLTFRLPTEAEWEYAARGGNKSKGYKYSGSNTVGNVAWYKDNSGGKTHPVKTKKANELGLYDMSGNVSECCEKWDFSYGSNGNFPHSPRADRGGDRGDVAYMCRVSARGLGESHRRYKGSGFRLVLGEASGCDAFKKSVKEDLSVGNCEKAEYFYNQFYLGEYKCLSDKDIELQIAECTKKDQTIIVNGVSFKMVYVEGGTFTMGCTSEQGDECYDNEKPAHQVTLSSYSIGETEVTQALWQAVIGNNPSYYKGDDLPVEQVSWDDVQDFIRELNRKTGRTFRLPTEAEWEYAARGGYKSSGYKYSGSNTIGDVAWYWDNSEWKTHPVKTKKANEFGLYDMSGNVEEWCEDWYGDYGSASQTNPKGPSTGSYRVFRGGRFNDSARDCRVSDRSYFSASYRYRSLGFRLVLVQ